MRAEDVSGSPEEGPWVYSRTDYWVQRSLDLANVSPEWAAYLEVNPWDECDDPEEQSESWSAFDRITGAVRSATLRFTRLVSLLRRVPLACRMELRDRSISGCRKPRLACAIGDETFECNRSWTGRHCNNGHFVGRDHSRSFRSGESSGLRHLRNSCGRNRCSDMPWMQLGDTCVRCATCLLTTTAKARFVGGMVEHMTVWVAGLPSGRGGHQPRAAAALATSRRFWQFHGRHVVGTESRAPCSQIAAPVPDRDNEVRST